MLLVNIIRVAEISAGKLDIRLNMRFSHFVKHRRGAMLRRNLQLTRNVVLHKLSEKVLILVEQKIIVANATSYKNLFYIRQFSDTAQNIKVFAVVNAKVFARPGRKALFTLAQSVLLLHFARWSPKVSGRPSYIMYVALKSGHIGKLFRLCDNALFTARGNISSLVKGYGAKIARAKASAVVGDGKLDLCDSGYAARTFVHRMIRPCIRQRIHPVKLRCRKRRHGRILHHHQRSVALFNHPAPNMILLILLHARRLCVLFF